MSAAVVLSTSVAPVIVPVNILEKGQRLESSEGSQHSAFGRAVNERPDAPHETLQEPGQGSESGQHHSGTIDPTQNGHCQFYADCADCHRFPAKAADKTTQPLDIYDSTKHKPDSCQRIKTHNEPTSQIILRAHS